MYQLKRKSICMLLIYMKYLTKTASLIVVKILVTVSVIWVLKMKANMLCLSQIINIFGFLPTDSLQLYTDPVYYETIKDIISTHLMVKKSGLPNFLKCRIPVKSKLKVD